jgi:hypothetical protein
MTYITKKFFKEQASIHDYGKHTKVLYLDWKAAFSKKDGSFVGFKYAIAAQFITKAQLLKIAYDRIILNKDIFHDTWMGFKVAIEDKDRFKVPIVLNFDIFTDSQSKFEETELS